MDRIIETGKIGQQLGAKIIGLGAFSSIVGDAGITVAKNLDIAVTTGNSYTVATALEGTKEAARLMGKDFSKCHALVVGATGSIGSAVARILADEVAKVTMVARRMEPLEELAQEIIRNGKSEVAVSGDIRTALKDADIVLTVTSALDFIIEPEYLKPGAVVCDVARPRNVSREVADKRNDVLVIEGAPESEGPECTIEQAVEMVKQLVEEGEKTISACKRVASETGYKKSELYQLIVNDK